MMMRHQTLHRARPAPIDTRGIEATLERMPLFSGLGLDELARLSRGCSMLVHKRGKILFRKGDPSHGFYLVVSGQIKLAFCTADGHEKVVEILRPGQSFGEAVMFMERPSVLMAEALTDCHVLFVSRDTVFGELERNPGLARKLLAGLSWRLHHLICELEDQTLRSGRERIIGYLLREKNQHEHLTLKGPVLLQLPTKKETIASLLSMTPEYFSRVLHDLNETGLIEIRGRTIFIPDISRLHMELT